MYKEHVESFARAFGVFSAAFIATRWASKSSPFYDTWLIMIAAILGVLLAR